MRALEPLGACLDAPRWHAAMLCLLCLLDHAAKHMVVLKDALVADLLTFLEDVAEAGRGCPASPGGGAAGRAAFGGGQRQTVRSQARSLRALLLRMSE